MSQETPFSEPPRPEIALMAQLGQRKPTILRPYHLTNIDRPWETACGLPLDGTTVKPLGAGDWTCQHPACRRALFMALGRG